MVVEACCFTWLMIFFNDFFSELVDFLMNSPELNRLILGEEMHSKKKRGKLNREGITCRGVNFYNVQFWLRKQRLLQVQKHGLHIFVFHLVFRIRKSDFSFELIIPIRWYNLYSVTVFKRDTKKSVFKFPSHVFNTRESTTGITSKVQTRCPLMKYEESIEHQRCGLQ